MARKKNVKPTIPPAESPFLEFDAAYLVKRLALFKGVLLRRAIRKDCASYHFTATPEGKVTVAVTNLNEGLLLKVDVLRATGIGTVMVDALALNALLGAFAEPRFRLHLDDPVQIHAGFLQTKMVVPGYDPEKELKVTAPPSLTTTGWIVRGSALALALATVEPFRDTKNTRYALDGVALVFPEQEGAQLELVSTDGRRLSRYKIPVKAHGEGPARLVHPANSKNQGLPILPDRAIAVAQKLARIAGETSVALCVIPGQPKDLEKNEYEPGSVQVVTKDAVLTAACPDGRFPLYQEVFPPGEPAATVTLEDATGLAQLVAQAVAASDTEHKGLELVAAGGCVMITAGSAMKGKVELSLIDVPMTGKFTIDLDAKMFRDVLAVIESDGVVIKFFDRKSPLVFQCGEWLECVLMPLTRDNYEPEPEPKPEVPSGAAPAPQGEEAPPKKSRRGKKPKDGRDDDGSAPVDPTPTPAPLTPVAVVPGGHETNGHAKPRPRPRGKTT